MHLRVESFLMDERSEPRVGKIEREEKLVPSRFAVRDNGLTRRQPARHAEAEPAEVDEICGAREYERAVVYAQRQRHSDAVADVFLEPRWTRKSLCRVDDLREPLFCP